MMLLRLKIMACLIALLAPLGVFNVAQAQDVSAYFMHTDIEHVSFSPSGEFYAVFDPDFNLEAFTDGEVIVRRSKDNKIRKTIKTNNRTVNWIAWIDENRLAVYSRGFYAVDNGRKKSVEKLRDSVELYDLRSGKIEVLYHQELNKRNEAAAEITVVGSDPSDNALIVSFRTNGRAQLMKMGPSYNSPKSILTGTKDTKRWILDSRNRPRLRIDRAGTSYIEHYFRPEGSVRNNWRHFYTANNLDSRFTVVGLPPDENTIYVLRRSDNDLTTGLYSLRTDKNIPPKLIYQNPDFDLAGAESFGPNSELYYAYWWEDRMEKHWFSKKHAKIAARLEKKLPPNSNWSIQDVIGDDEYWLISHSAAGSPPAVSIWVNGKMRLVPVLETDRSYDERSTPVKQRFDFTASDGRALFGYFTPAIIPSRHGDFDGPSQLLVLPHKGPGFRDRLEWDPWAQYFASEGYDVFQPQFRGSGGFGREFEDLAYGQWGGKMQSDITDGVAALEASGKIKADADRAIVGQAYGGYAALNAAQQEPGRYKCVVSVNGISDLSALLGHFDMDVPQQRYSYYNWETKLGDIVKSDVRMAQYSPAKNAGKMQSRLFLVHGRDNDVIPVAQSEVMHRAAKNAGLPSTLVRFAGIGHTEWSREEEYDILSAIDGFLQRCMR